MNNLIKIGNQSISQKEINGMRVVTLADIDNVHERTRGTARRNFNSNKERLIEGEDYIVRNSYEAKTEFNVIAPNGLTLVTESGYLMLVKSFTDDLAWTVQRQLVSNYFRSSKPMTALDQLRVASEAILEVSEKVTEVDRDLQNFKQDMPILGIEESKITNAAKRKGASCLGGKKSEAYKDASIRQKVFSDIYRELKRQFGVGSYKAIKRSQCDDAVRLIERYKLPLFLEELINDCNAQMAL